MDPCGLPTGQFGLWAFVLVAVLSHARGAALLLRAAFGVMVDWQAKRNRRRPRLYTTRKR
jgi:hypothetical protein